MERSGFPRRKKKKKKKEDKISKSRFQEMSEPSSC